jgi:hypothetical protein
MRESSEEDFGVREVAGFVVSEGVRREDVQGMDLKKSYEEEGEGAIFRNMVVGRNGSLIFLVCD